MKLADFPFWMRLVFCVLLFLFGINLLLFVPGLAAMVPWSKLESWQTLVAGILALVGAIATVVVIHAQIRQAEKLAEERRSREEIAARAVLPLALSELTRYATACIKLVSTYAPYAPNPVIGNAPPSVPAGLSLPTVSADVISTLRDCVRFGDNQTVRQIATLLAFLQVQRARLQSLVSTAAARQTSQMFRFEAISAMIDAAELYAKTTALFNYGREVADMGARSARAEIESAFFISGIVTIDDPELYQVVSGRYD